MSEPIARLIDVKKTFHQMDQPLHVLKGINLELQPGELVAIVGQSGAGKSTLLHCLGTLDLPTSGQIIIQGQDVVNMSSTALSALRNRTIGFVFQFHHLLPEFTALENVMMPGLIAGRPRKEVIKRAEQLLEEVGLGERLAHRPGELSGGEQQRVALARALFLDPPLVLADEPTGNLDSTTSEAINDLFFSINEKRGTTVVVVTHNLAFAERMPRVIRLRDGRLESDVRKDVGDQKQAASKKAEDA